MSKGFASNGRMTLLALAVLSCFLCVAVRLIFLHVIDRDDLLKFVERARRQIVVENARRGAILDTKGNILATSRSFVVLGADPELLRREDERNWPELARLLHVSSEQLVQLLRRGSAAHALALATPDPAVKERSERTGNYPVTNTPEQFSAFIVKEADRWGKVIKETGIKFD